MYTLHTLVEKHVHQTNKGKIFGCFIDFHKAFDSVLHDGLFLKLLESGIGGKVYHIIKDMYKGNKCCVKINNSRTQYFHQGRGVQQGCNLSSTLFNIFLNELATTLEQSSSPGLKSEGREIKCPLYADDLLILSPTEQGLHHSLTLLENHCKNWALSINMEKIKIMTFQSILYN